MLCNEVSNTDTCTILTSTVDTVLIYWLYNDMDMHDLNIDAVVIM